MNSSLDPDRRAELVVAQMTREEKQALVFGYFGTDAPWKKFTTPAESREGSAGYVPGIAAPRDPAAVDHGRGHRRGHAGRRQTEARAHGVALGHGHGGELGSRSWRGAPAR